MDATGLPPAPLVCSGRTPPWRFVSAAWAETTAALGPRCCGVLAIGAIAGAVHLCVAAGFSGAPRMLTSEFVALHVADAFRWPAYLVVVLCGGQIAHRHAVPESIAVASKVTALCVVVLAALTAFGIAAAGAQTARGTSTPDAGLCAYAVYINLGWHVLLLAAVTMAVQVALRDVIGAWPVPVISDVAKGSCFGMSIVGALLLVSWGLDGDLTPLGPAPAPYSGMNDYGHHLEKFFAAGLFWTALTLIVVLAAHAWTCRVGARRWLPRVMVNVGLPTVVICVATGCWMYVDMPDRHRNEGQSHRLPSDNPGWLTTRPGVIHVVAVDLKVDIYPVERRLESRGSMLLANAGAEPIGELALSFREGTRLHRIDVPSVVEHVAQSGLQRYVFARPLRPGERVRMGFELAWEQRGLGDGRALIENGTFIEATDVMPDFAHRSALQGGAARIRVVIGTSLDQVAVGPGILLREWKENARRYFEYARAASASSHRSPSTARGGVLPALSIHSARYAFARERHDDLTVEVYYHPDHGRIVGAVFGCVGQYLERVGRSLLYPHQVLRIVEFPYAGKVRVFPDAIAFSEQREFAFAPRGFDALCESVAGAMTRQYDGDPGAKS